VVFGPYPTLTLHFSFILAVPSFFPHLYLPPSGSITHVNGEKRGNGEGEAVKGGNG